jgi:pimeloyl-ACP methyl ester carboxylesterase
MVTQEEKVEPARGWMAAITAFVAATAALSLLALLRRWRDRLMPRRDPRLPFEELMLTSGDGTPLCARRIGDHRREAVIVAHPAVTGQRYTPLVGLAELLAERFTVYTFDFRGHGASGGHLEISLEGPVEDLGAATEYARSRGHNWVGVVGFSLGGMAALVRVALHGDLDAVVAVSAPPAFPDVERYRRWLPLWSLFLRFLGARFRPRGPAGPVPLGVAGRLPEIPLLIVHGEREVFYRREDLERMLELAKGKPELWVLYGAAHTELAGRERDLLRWLEDKAEARGRHHDGELPRDLGSI